MSCTVFLGNLPVWVTADDIKSWLAAENLVADSIKVIRNPETQESKGFAFIDAPNQDEMNSIIRRFDRAPLEDRLLRANPAQPPRPKGVIAARTPVASSVGSSPPPGAGAALELAPVPVPGRRSAAGPRPPPRQEAQARPYGPDAAQRVRRGVGKGAVVSGSPSKDPAARARGASAAGGRVFSGSFPENIRLPVLYSRPGFVVPYMNIG